MGLPGIVALMVMMNNNASLAAATSARRSSRHVSPSSPQPNRYGDQYKEQILRNVIRRARPTWFGWFDVCPLNEASEILNIPERNEAYRLLSAFHCVGYFNIPRAIRRRIPELIREALSEGVEKEGL